MLSTRLQRLVSAVRHRYAVMCDMSYVVFHDDSGLTIKGVALDRDVSHSNFVPWDVIRSIEAFKRDMSLVDQLCLSVESDEGVYELNEDMSGWNDVVLALPSHLGGCWPWDRWLDDLTERLRSNTRLEIYSKPGS